MSDQQPAQERRPPRILWVAAYCLLDTSSGASISIYQMLKQLKAIGCEIGIVGATIFDAEKGKLRLQQHWDAIQENEDKIIKINDSGFVHHLAVTTQTHRPSMTAEEIGNWYNVYISVLETIKPDLVFFYGGHPIDLIIPDEARMRGIPSAAYLVNENYSGARWCRDVDVIITDTQATADLYKRKDGYTLTPVGKFIDRQKAVAETNSRERLLFINPAPQKGSAIVAQLALLIGRVRPDITFEVVESRGDWPEIVREVCKASGISEETLTNVVVTPNTDDIREVYSRARALLAPSLWWESGARVLAEAMLNGIPAIVTVNGGNQEMIRNAGIHIKLPEACHVKPYDQLPHLELLAPLVEKIIKLYDDEVYYQSLVERAYRVGQELHDINQSTQRLVRAFQPLLNISAGNNDFRAQEAKQHKQAIHDVFMVVRDNNLAMPLGEGEKGIFIDCGGYDGCSAVKFMVQNPNFDAITFEPNPALWKYYDYVPTCLVKKAAYTYNGKIKFTIDETDADGSSVIESKKIDYWGKVDNADCPKIEAECVDLSDVIRWAKDSYSKIILKLDIEGAEYDVLDKLLAENLVGCLNRIYCEFHWQKCGFTHERHLNLIEQLRNHTEVSEWDALDFAVHNEVEGRIRERKKLVTDRLKDRLTKIQTRPTGLTL